MLNVRNVVREFEYGIVSNLSSFLDSIAGFFEELERKLIEERKREEIRALLKLDEVQLSDMGITRDDIHSALLQPLDESSGKRLNAARKMRARV